MVPRQPSRPRAAILSVAFLLLLWQSAVDGDDKPHPFPRSKKRALSTTTGTGAEQAAPAKLSFFDDAESRLNFYRTLMKDRKVDGMELMAAAVNSKGFKKILDHSELQRQILEELPLMAALEGFKELIDDKDATPAQSKAGFARGLQEMVRFGKEGLAKIQDPGVMIDVMTRLAQTGDDDTKALFVRARGGDKSAHKQLQHIVAAEMFPGTHMSAVEDAAKRSKAERLLAIPEVMTYIDQDPHISKAFRAVMGEHLKRRQEDTPTTTTTTAGGGGS